MSVPFLPITPAGAPFVGVNLPIDLQPIVSGLKPGMRMVVLMFEGSTSESSHAALSSPNASQRPFDGPNTHARADDDFATAVDVAADLVGRAPETPLRIEEWAERLRRFRISARELTRGVRGGWIPSVPKGSGRDHRAQLIRPADMLHFLEIREEGLRPGGHRPAWFVEVVMEAPYVA